MGVALLYPQRPLRVGGGTEFCPASYLAPGTRPLNTATPWPAAGASRLVQDHGGQIAGQCPVGPRQRLAASPPPSAAFAALLSLPREKERGPVGAAGSAAGGPRDQPSHSAAWSSHSEGSVTLAWVLVYKGKVKFFVSEKELPAFLSRHKIIDLVLHHRESFLFL